MTSPWRDFSEGKFDLNILQNTCTFCFSKTDQAGRDFGVQLNGVDDCVTCPL